LQRSEVLALMADILILALPTAILVPAVNAQRQLARGVDVSGWGSMLYPPARQRSSRSFDRRF
jgi:hypothetical protein